MLATASAQDGDQPFKPSLGVPHPRIDSHDRLTIRVVCGKPCIAAVSAKDPRSSDLTVRSITISGSRRTIHMRLPRSSVRRIRRSGRTRLKLGMSATERLTTLQQPQTADVDRTVTVHGARGAAKAPKPVPLRTRVERAVKTEVVDRYDLQLVGVDCTRLTSRRFKCSYAGLARSNSSTCRGVARVTLYGRTIDVTSVSRPRC